MITARLDPGELAAEWEAALGRLAAADAVERLANGDHTVIQQDPTECADRLGWLAAPGTASRDWPSWALLAEEIVDGPADREIGELSDVLVIGMGGSSLFPEVLATTFDGGDGFPRLGILDTTHPDAVQRVTDRLDPATTLVVVASKSGSTVETRSHMEHFWARSPIGRGFAAITDPGSGLEELATRRGFRAVVHGVPEIGGRFSALSAFGMFPAALMGLDAAPLLDTALEAAEVLGPGAPVQDNPACQLGALMAVAAVSGRDRLTVHTAPALSALGAWLEQLVAESTGKHGVGVLPVVGEPPDAPDPGSRLHVLIGDTGIDPATLEGPWVELAVEEPADLGAQVYLWEMATTMCGIVLGINPFDQPDVESAKRAARARLEGASDGERPAEGTVDGALALLRDGDALALCCFVDPVLEPQLQEVRLALGRRAGVATTLGMGPRFLHSTGQLHKGGADRQVVVQVVDEPTVDVEVPGESFGFAELIRAQADGDVAALESAGKRVVRVRLEDLLAA